MNCGPYNYSKICKIQFFLFASNVAQTVEYRCTVDVLFNGVDIRQKMQVVPSEQIGLKLFLSELICQLQFQFRQLGNHFLSLVGLFVVASSTCTSSSQL